MPRRKESATSPGLRPWGKFIPLAALLLVAACPQAPKSGEDLRSEIQDLKKEVKVVEEKLDQLQANQKAMLELLKKPALPEVAGLPGPLPPPPPVQALSVSQLLASKDQYLGSRVTVKGKAGPVIAHRKSLLLVAPEGMVEVLLGSLPDEKTVVRLTSTPLEKPVTVTGMVSLPTQAAGPKLQITAEAVDF
jgi:hypothetical protein